MSELDAATEAYRLGQQAGYMLRGWKLTQGVRTEFSLNVRRAQAVGVQFDPADPLFAPLPPKKTKRPKRA